jgi:hypothetical protein
MFIGVLLDSWGARIGTAFTVLVSFDLVVAYDPDRLCLDVIN